MDLAELKFVVDTKQLEDAAKKIDALATSVSKVKVRFNLCIRYWIDTKAIRASCIVQVNKELPDLMITFW